MTEIDNIFGRATARESSIWGAFSYNGPFDSVHQEERILIFGLYSGAYLNGQTYLNDITAEDLAKLLDTYTANIAQLTNAEAQLVLEIAAKRYVERLEDQIHQSKIATKESELDALSDEYDARTAALDADYAALETKRKEVALAWTKAHQRVKELETLLELESVHLQEAEIEVTQQELASARADLARIEAVQRGLDIQLAITQTGIDKSNVNLQIVESQNEESEIGIRVSEAAIEGEALDLDADREAVKLERAVVDGERIQSDTKGISVRVSETQVGIAEAEAKQNEIDADISRIEADTAKLALVDSELSLEQSDLLVAQADNEVLRIEKQRIENQGANVQTRIESVEDQQEWQEGMDVKRLNLDQSKHDAGISESQKEREFEDGLKDKKVDLLQGPKRDIINKIRQRKFQDEQDKAEKLETQAAAQEAYKDAAIAAAELVANANLLTSLYHSVGEGDPPEATTQSWTAVSSI